MRVYDVGGMSDAELIKTKPKTPARVAPPLTAAEQRHVAERLTAAHADLALWRVCERKACGRRRRCGGDVDQCGARRSPRAWACVYEILAAIRAGTKPRTAARVAGRRARPQRQRTFSVSAFRLSGQGEARRRQMARGRRGTATAATDAAAAAAACRRRALDAGGGAGRSRVPAKRA